MTRRTSQDDLDEESAVDESGTVEEFVVLLLEGFFVSGTWRDKLPIFVDLQQLLGDILWQKS